MKIFSFVFQDNELHHYYYKGEALIRPNYPFFIPNIEEAYIACPALALRIGRTGKEVAARFAHRYIQSIGVGFDLIAPNLLEAKKISASPWEEAVAFEYASVAEGFAPMEDMPPSHTLHYYNSKVSQSVYTSTISEQAIRQAVECISHLNIIHIGDVLLLRNEEATPLPLALEEEIHISLDDDSQRSCTLRIK